MDEGLLVCHIPEQCLKYDHKVPPKVVLPRVETSAKLRKLTLGDTGATADTYTGFRQKAPTNAIFHPTT
jgi:hypothetical protein